MKMMRQLMTAAWLALAGQAMADDFTISNFSIQPGETKTISVELNNTEHGNIIAFEFYMSLPEGVSVVEDEDGYLLAELNGSRGTEDHDLVASKLADGSYRFFCYPFAYPLPTLNGTTGEILTMTITASETAEPMVGEGRLFGQILTGPNKEEWNLDDSTFQVMIGHQEGYCPHGYRIGDLNMDEKITVADVMQVVRLVIYQGSSSTMGLCPQGCLLGDLNNDGKISVADVMQVVRLVINH